MKDHRDFELINNSRFAVYDKNTSALTPINASLKHALGADDVHVDVWVSEGDSVFGTCNRIPIRLKSIRGDVVEVFLAQTKTTTRATEFTRLADLATDGFWEWYPSLNYEYMSERFWSILGYDQKDMGETPESWLGKINPEDGKNAMDVFEKHTDSKGKIPYYANVRYRHRDGSDVHIVCRGSVEEWLPDGKPWRIIGTHTDVTDIIKKDALEAREQFVSRMSHELRSPLCAVLNECDLLENKYDLSVIKDSCTQILYIANDVLSLNKLKSQELAADPEPCEPEELINNAIKRHRGEFKKKGLRISSSVDDMPGVVLLDKAKFNQILDNLLSNALKYTAKGRVSVDCDFDFEKSTLNVTVEDTGVGIPEEEQAKIFEEFFQGKSSMRGIGIGLHIVSVLCELLGGYVEVVESTPGEGTTMRFGVRAEVVSPAQGGPALDTKTLRVLVVDDMSTNRKYLNRKLQNLEDSMSFTVSEVVEAFDGEDAVRVFGKSKEAFDLVLMDCLMPIMDGFEATKKIHELCEERGIPHVPVIAVTASIADEIYEKCRDAGMVCVVTKPYSVADLRASIEKASVV
jgi:CheY-like chemotaxis protein/PAS domain-containing protein